MTLASCGASAQVWSDGSLTATAEPGSSHCDTQDVLFLQWEDRQYSRDPGQVLPAQVAFGEFAESVPIPADAADTGLRNGDREMWRAADGSALYVRDGAAADDANAERWPEIELWYGCD